MIIFKIVPKDNKPIAPAIKIYWCKFELIVGAKYGLKIEYTIPIKKNTIDNKGSILSLMIYIITIIYFNINFII